MTKNKKIIPELRFPEFENEGSWTKKRLADFDDLPSGDGDWILSKDISLNGSYKIVQLSSIGFGSFKEKVLKTISEETFAELNGTPIRKGDLLINRMVDANKINCCIFPYENKYVTSVDVCWIRQNDSINNYFLMSLLSTGDNQIKLLSLSSGAGRVRISKSNLFENFFFPLPKNKKEEQKIASCLSSLDEVIDVHTKKLELLIDHKKGLIQNLFPQEGEKVPKLRFKEFENDGEWVEKKLDEICNVNPSSNELPSEFIYIDLESVENGILTPKNKITLDEAPSRAQRLLKKDDVIYQMVRPYQMNNYFFEIESKTAYVASTGYAQLRAFYSSKFLFQLIHTQNFVDKVLTKCTGSNYPAINSSDLKSVKSQVPKPKEQQKIADTLSSLDTLIKEQADKIALLKLHKKGLMQGLFPKIID